MEENFKFYDDKNNKKIRSTLFSDVAEGKAKCIADDRKKSAKDIDKQSQIRKFFDELLKYNDIVNNSDNKEAKFDECLPLVNMIVAKAAYARGRNLISINFYNFLKNIIGQIKDYKDLKNATLFFESFIAFYKFYCPKED
ncbi:MAG: type III-A CRISPR-associated protein Csm2 [Bdellovibrionota bacterium]